MKQVMKQALSLVLVLAMIFTLTPMVASATELGTEDNPYQLTTESRLIVTVEPQQNVYIQASSGVGHVEVGYFTTMDWYLKYDYNRLTVSPTQTVVSGIGAATRLALTGHDTFYVHNSSDTESVTMIITFVEGEEIPTLGEEENPENVTLVEESFDGSWKQYVSKDLPQCNSGYYYTFETPIDGKLRVRINAMDVDKQTMDWEYYVNNETAGVKGEFHCSSWEVVVREEILDVKEGDKITI